MSKRQQLHLIVEQLNLEYYHTNSGFLKAYLANQFWIVGLNCIAVDGLTAPPPEGVSVLHPFLIIGIDFCGPFKTKYVRHRSTTQYKLCFVYFGTQF